MSSIQWFDVNGGTNTVASTDYILDVASRIPRVTPAANKFWPTSPSLVPQNGVVATLVAGAPSVSGVPPTLLQAILLLIGHWYVNRQEVLVDKQIKALGLPTAAKALIGLHQPMLVG